MAWKIFFIDIDRVVRIRIRQRGDAKARQEA